MRMPPQLPPPLDLAPFHVSEALELGVPSARLRRSDLVAPFRGIRSSTEITTTCERCLSYLPLLAPDQSFSHATAAVLWGMWIPRRLRDRAIDVTSLGASREPRIHGVRGHSVSADRVAVEVVRGLPVTSPLDTWRLMADILSVDELVVAGDSLVRRQFPLASLIDLPHVLDGCAGARGAASLRRAVGLVRAGADSPRETRLRLLLTRAGLPEPLVNAEVSAPGSAVRRFGDLVYPAQYVIVEYDGEQHRTDSRRYAADVARLDALALAGWFVIRVLAHDLADANALARRVARVIHDRGWQQPRSKLQLLR